MRTRIEAVGISALLLLSVACGLLAGEEPESSPTTEPDRQGTAIPPTPTPIESGFGGLFLDPKDNSIVYVYLLNPSQEAAESWARSLGSSIREVRVLQGQYSIKQLVEWHDRMMQDTVHNIPGVFMSGIDQGNNRIKIGVDNKVDVEKVQEAVEAELDKLGIPREAVIIRVIQRPVPAS